MFTYNIMVRSVYFHHRGWSGTRSLAARRIQRVFRRRRGNVNRRQNRNIRTLFKRTKKEQKYIDQNQLTIVPYGWVTLLPRPLTYTTQGDSNNQRIGNKISVHSIQLNGFMQVQDTTNRLRILVVRFGRAAPQSVGIDDFLTNGTTAANPFHLLAMKARNSNNPYKILADRSYNLTGNDTAGSPVTVGSIKSFKIRIKLKGKMQSTFYKLDSDTLPTEGYIYVVASSDSALSGPSVWLQSRMIFSG